MSDVVSGMSAPQFIALVAVVGGLLVFLAAIAVPFLAWTRRVEALAQLKRDLAVAGYSADEIERIVLAGQGRSAGASR